MIRILPHVQAYFPNSFGSKHTSGGGSSRGTAGVYGVVAKNEMIAMMSNRMVIWRPFLTGPNEPLARCAEVLFDAIADAELAQIPHRDLDRAVPEDRLKRDDGLSALNRLTSAR